MPHPNHLTLSRIAALPPFAVLLYLPHDWTYPASAALFALAAATDWLDGHLARRRNQQTPFGAFLDPVADKLLVTTALVLLIAKYPSPALTLAGLLIIGRELTVTALREWMAQLGRHSTVAVSPLGKAKTATQLIAIILLCLCQPGTSWASLPLGTWGFNTGQALLYLATRLSLHSLAQYLKAALKSKPS